MDIQIEIKKLEEFIGFPIKKREVTLESGESHDETFSYSLCQRFYGKENELKNAINQGNKILSELLKCQKSKISEHAQEPPVIYERFLTNKRDAKQIETFYSLIGNMHYLLGDFKFAAGYFMKCLSYNKNDVSHWVELLFCLRALEEFELFEKGMFNFERLNLAWKNDKEKNLTQEGVIDIIKKVGQYKSSENKNVLGIVQVTRYCNERCVFCSVPPLNDGPPLGELKRRIEEMKKQGTTNLMLSGGEPTLNNYLEEIIVYAKSLGFNSISMQTNGIMLNNKNKIRDLYSAGLSDIFVSFHSHIKEVYDKLTNTNGNYNKALKALKLISESECKLGINITINSLNYQHLPELIEFLLKNFNNIFSFSINYCDPLGNALKNTWIVPKLSDVKPYLHESLNILKNSNKHFMVDFVPLCFMEEFEEHCTEKKVHNKELEEKVNFFGDENNFDGIQNGDTHKKVKSDKCNLCKYNGECGGLNKRYVNLYGCDEIMPFIEAKSYKGVPTKYSKKKKTMLVWPFYPTQKKFLTANISIALISKFLSDNKFDVVCYDFNLIYYEKWRGEEEKLSPDRILKKFVSLTKLENPDIIGIGGYSQHTGFIKQYTDLIKKEMPDVSIILGGMNPTLIPENILELCNSVDYLIRGSEYSPILELCESIKEGISPKKIKNCSYRLEDGTIINNALCDFQSNNLPIYDFENFYYLGKRPFLNILTSRGCAHNCSFCCSNNLTKKFVPYDEHFFIKQINKLYDMYGPNHFSIVDDDFLISESRINKIAPEISRLDCDFACAGRVDEINVNKLRLLKDNKFHWIGIGVENVVPKIIKFFNKSKDANQFQRGINEGIKKLIKVQIDFSVSLILGSPIETEKDLLKNYLFAKSIKEYCKQVDVGPLMVLPGTKIWNDYVSKKIEVIKLDSKPISPFDYKFRDFIWAVPELFRVRNKNFGVEEQINVVNRYIDLIQKLY